MSPWITIPLAVTGAAATASWLGRRRQRRLVASLHASLSAAEGAAAASTVSDHRTLPPPVARYLRHVLPANRGVIRLARYRQIGSLRTDIRRDRWFAFTASQLVAPPAAGFVWDAQVSVLPGLQLRVCDSLIDGVGAGQVALWSAITIASAAGDAELNAGALHRFLAEAVWYPSALRPSSHLHWDAIDDRSALATMRYGDLSVSLEFRFDDNDQVTGIYTPARWGSFDGGYRQLPWEGRFCDYRSRDGVRVPGYGAVGWHVDGRLQMVWQGGIVGARFEFD